MKTLVLSPVRTLTPTLLQVRHGTQGQGRLRLSRRRLCRWLSKSRVPSKPIGCGVFDLFTNPEKYKGTEYYLGAANAEQLQTTFYERLQQAEDRVKAGEDYRTVATEMQAGIIAQVGDMAGQGIADPLNYAGLAETAVGKVASDITGDKIAAEAFRQSAMSESPGVMNAKDRIKNIINTPAKQSRSTRTTRYKNWGLSLSGWLDSIQRDRSRQVASLIKGY